MIGLDTNVLLRLFIDDDAAQCQRARAFVDAASEDEPCLVNLVVLVEFVWALSKPLRQPKQEVIKYLDGLLQSDDLAIERKAAALAALAAYRSGAADFSDYLLAEVNSGLGCSSTATFDGEAAKSKLFTSVP